jgi:hypothetical protein
MLGLSHFSLAEFFHSFRGAGGISGKSFQKVKVIFFKKLKCYKEINI